MDNRKSITNYKVLFRDFVIVNIAAGGALLSMLLVVMLQRYGILPSFPCGIHELFKVYCPGCGGTRAAFALLQGHILQSLFYNPAVLLGILLILYYECGVIITLAKKDGKCYFYKRTGLIYGYLFIVLLFTIIRDWLLLGYHVDMLKDFIK